ncbi:MAG: hypothetical protein NT049_16950, partial [Planctomycetota bacterium]|nr:hypothetical protein [Planctomycetota bacterium]
MVTSRDTHARIAAAGRRWPFVLKIADWYDRKFGPLYLMKAFRAGPHYTVRVLRVARPLVLASLVILLVIEGLKAEERSLAPAIITAISAFVYVVILNLLEGRHKQAPWLVLAQIAGDTAFPVFVDLFCG